MLQVMVSSESASPGSECDAFCDAVVAAQAGSRNLKSVILSSDCDLDSRSSSLCAVTSRPRSGCARMNSQWLHSARGNSGTCYFVLVYV